MSTESPYTSPNDPSAQGIVSAPVPKPRLWPALVLVAAFWVVLTFTNVFGSAVFSPIGQFLTLFYAPMILAVGILVWLLFFSRQSWRDRLSGLGLLIAGGIGAALLSHPSMAMGIMMNAMPVAITAFVLASLVVHYTEPRFGWALITIASLLAWGYFTLLRFDGVTGNFAAERSWRWSETAEDKFLAERKSKQGSGGDQAAEELVATESDWPEFRGPKRDSHLHNVSLSADWTAQPPRELWRRRVGPGWSSFAVVGNRAFTQEQRGESEAVVCIDTATGNEIWSHEDKARFYDVVAGAGPRGTPTFHAGKIFACGGSGVLNCLDAASGKLLWSHDITIDGKSNPSAPNLKPPQWGYASSPLIVQGIVTVFAGGKDGKSVLGYDAASGELRWFAGKGTHSYSSPHLFTAAGQEQVLMVSEHGLEAFDPVTGKVLWDHDWNLKEMFRVVQPHILSDSQILVGTPMFEGTRLLTVAKSGDEWTVKEEWTTKDLKPYYNDFVQLGDYLYGYDGDILVCIDLATGKKKWKKGRYGNGQALLLGDQGQMLVISEEGEAVLTEVSPQGLKELSKFKALTGKTWNHPVIAAGKLLVRNGEEMACFELGATQPLASQ